VQRRRCSGISVAGLGPHQGRWPAIQCEQRYNASTRQPLRSTRPRQRTVFSLAAGTYTTVQTIKLTDAAAGATIYYTTDGSTPEIYSTKYIGPMTVPVSETVQAIAAATGYSPRPRGVGSLRPHLPAASMRCFSLAAGEYAQAQTVTIADASPEATIYYTTNGSTPTTNSTHYTGPITVAASETLAAMATAGDSRIARSLQRST